MFTLVTPPGGGPPLHHHENEDELFSVLEGRGDSSAVALVSLRFGILAAPIVRPAVTQLRNVHMAASEVSTNTSNAKTIPK